MSISCVRSFYFMSNKNILSIDMDYILSPCINIYNDLVVANLPPENIWETVSKLRDADKHISYDNENLHYIFNVFSNALSKLKDKKNVSFALNHDAILFDLASEKYKEDTFTLYNIDHHHDIFYSEQARIDVDKYDVANVANWIWYLDKNNKISQYNWICNKNSVFPPNNLQTNGQMNAYIAEDKKDIFDVDEWEHIFICNSPHWFPRDYDVFFEMLKIIYENTTGNKKDVNINVFSPNGLSRPYPLKNK